MHLWVKSCGSLAKTYEVNYNLCHIKFKLQPRVKSPILFCHEKVWHNKNYYILMCCVCTTCFTFPEIFVLRALWECVLMWMSSVLAHTLDEIYRVPACVTVERVAKFTELWNWTCLHVMPGPPLLTLPRWTGHLTSLSSSFLSHEKGGINFLTGLPGGWEIMNVHIKYIYLKKRVDSE